MTENEIGSMKEGGPSADFLLCYFDFRFPTFLFSGGKWPFSRLLLQIINVFRPFIESFWVKISAI